MDNNSIILTCSACRAKNRVPVGRLKDHPVCGKCKARLPVDLLGRVLDINDSTFDQEVLASSMPVLVDCWAPWCGPCRAFAPVLDQIARTYDTRLKVTKLNVDENPMTGSRYSITSVPTLLLVKNGQVVEQVAGALPKEQLEIYIGKIL